MFVSNRVLLQGRVRGVCLSVSVCVRASEGWTVRSEALDPGEGRSNDSTQHAPHVALSNPLRARARIHTSLMSVSCLVCCTELYQRKSLRLA